MSLTIKQKQDFYDKLARHDWWYNMSEDPTAYRKGRSEHLAITSMLGLDGWYRAMYNAWCDYKASGDPTLRPVRPE